MTAEPAWRLKIDFAEGTSISIRFDPGYFVGVFEPLLDPQLFNRVSVERGRLTWPGASN